MQPLITQDLLRAGFGQGADFAVLTNAMELDESSTSDIPVLKMTGSSSVQDLQGDYMAVTALQNMTQAPQNLTIWLNHSYNLPDDVFGGLWTTPSMTIDKNIVDLNLKVGVELDNPPAARTFKMIVNKGRRFGCSVGAQVIDWEYGDDGSIIITKLYVVEWSVVGVPANQRCWVENAISGMFQRSLAEGRGDDALKIAPSFKSLYSRDYQKILGNIESQGLRSDLSRIEARKSAPQTLFWDANTNQFFVKGLRDNKKTLSRDEVSNLLTHSVESNAIILPLSKSGENVLSTDNGGETLVRQDLETTENKDETMKTASEVAINSDGSHEVASGIHTHAHASFGDTEEHAHVHDGDANHQTDSEDTTSKGAEEISEETSTDTEIETKSVPSEDSDEADRESHKDQDQDETPIDPHRQALLAGYNAIGLQLGFEAASFKKKEMQAFDLQTAISLISQADAYIDQLMALFGIPDIDKDQSQAVDEWSINTETSLMKAFTSMLQKDGREFSDKNQKLIKSMHDQARSLHDVCKSMSAACCVCDDMSGDSTPAADNGTDFENARQDAQNQMGQITNSMDSLTKALGQLNIPQMQSDLEASKRELDTVNQKIAQSKHELGTLNSTVAAIKDMPLGRPTQINRGISSEASYQEYSKVLAQTLQDALAHTEVVTKGGMKYRHWSNNVGIGVRPALTPDQKSMMYPHHILSYSDGGEADVPMVDDPLD